MRIMFVSGETPLFPAGGIATYLCHIVPALKACGHEVFLFTFLDVTQYCVTKATSPFDPDNVHVEIIDVKVVHERYPSISHFHAVSNYLVAPLLDLVKKWEIDVIEATDYQAPCLALFQLLQTRIGAERQLLSTYHHGLGEVIFEADQIAYPNWAKANNLAERQQMRSSDLVVVPSCASEARLRTLDVRCETRLVREPYVFREKFKPFGETRNEIQYVGRLSIQKGIDKLVYVANVLHSVLPLRKIELIGRISVTPFRQNDVIEYLKGRLNPELKERLFCSDFISRQVVMDLLQDSVISPHLGTDETFSYACVESIDASQLPIVRQGTAMAEFFPEDIRNFTLDEKMRSVSELQRKFENILSHASEIVLRVQEHCRDTLHPQKVGQHLSEVYAEALYRKRDRRIHKSAKPEININDITVLIPAYKPNAEFMETIDSIASQSAGLASVLICDDGTPDAYQPWFDYALARLSRCRIIRQPNGGLLAARNTLIGECQTSLAIFLDTDDLFAPDLLANLIEAWNSSPIDLDAVIPQRRNFGESNELIMRHLLDDYMHLLENDYRMTALIRRDILAEIGFDSTRRNGEADDWAFWLEFTSRGYRGAMLPEPGFLYRFRNGSMSWPWSEGQKIGTQTMLREVIQNFPSKNIHKSMSVARALYAQATSK